MELRDAVDESIYTRAKRIRCLGDWIKACNKRGRPADWEKTIACFGMDYDVARRTVIEYLNFLKSTGKILVVGNEMFWKDVPEYQAFPEDKIICKEKMGEKIFMTKEEEKAKNEEMEKELLIRLEDNLKKMNERLALEGCPLDTREAEKWALEKYGKKDDKA